MRVLVVGASGYIGKKLGQKLAVRHEVTGTFCRSGQVLTGCGQTVQADIRRLDQVRSLWQRTRPEAVIHLAYDRLDLSGSIVQGTRNLLQAWRKTGAASRFVFVSTGAVFDGERGPYVEEDEPRPITQYGQAKRAAEEEVLAAGGQIVRVSLVYGHTPLDPQTRILIHGLQTGSFSYPYFVDEIRCPVHIDDLTSGMVECLEMESAQPVLHLAGPQPMSRYALAISLSAYMGYDPAPIPWARLAHSGLARPRDLTLDTTKASDLLTTRLRSVDRVLGRP